jgi:hypothetical protein
MRTREEIEEDNEGEELSNKQVLEVLLDIRDLLQDLPANLK